MNAFQWLGLALVGFLIVLSGMGLIRRQARSGAAGAWILLWLLTAVVLIRPEITVICAQFLGIGRGADLVFYCAILATMLGFFVTYLRARKLEASVTKLVRRIALMEVKAPHVGSGQSCTSMRAAEKTHAAPNQVI